MLGDGSCEGGSFADGMVAGVMVRTIEGVVGEAVAGRAVAPADGGVLTIGVDAVIIPPRTGCKAYGGSHDPALGSITQFAQAESKPRTSAGIET